MSLIDLGRKAASAPLTFDDAPRKNAINLSFCVAARIGFVTRVADNATEVVTAIASPFNRESRPSLTHS